MAYSPRRLQSLTVFLLICFLVAERSAFSATERWISLTSFNNVRQMLYSHDTIFATTAGGLMVIPDTNIPPTTYVNTDGLGTTDLTDIIVDQAGQKWIAGFGQLIKWSTHSVRRFPFTNEDGPDRLTALADDGDQLWVGTEQGLVLFSKTIDGGQFQDRFGVTIINSFPIINDIYIDGNNIWLATSSGLARGDKRFPALLKSPANWQLFNATTDSVLVYDPVSRVLRFESILFFGTPKGIFRIDPTADSSVVQMPFGINRTVYDMRDDNDTLFMYQDGGIRRYVNGGVANVPTAGLPSVPNTGVNTGFMRWFGLFGGGISFTQVNSFAGYPYMGVPYNTVTDVAVGADGSITAGFYKTNRMGILNNSIWTLYNTVDNFTTAASRDEFGSFWMGSWGTGLYRVTNGVLKNYRGSNSSLRGGGDPGGSPNDYVVIRDIDIDHQYIYVAAFQAYNGYPVAIGKLDNLDAASGWDSLGMLDGITDTRVTSIDVWKEFLAVGTEDNGLFFYSFGDFRNTKSDDSCAHLTENNAFLVSNTIRTARFNSKGELWVGTSFGICRYDAGIERFVDVNLPAGFGPDILSLTFDVRDNIWAGSVNGIARIDATTGQIQVYTTQNSGLLADQASTVTVDLLTNNLYVATNAGISILLSPIGDPAQEIKKVLAFPNPFVITDATDRLRFNYGGNGTVRIFTEAADPVTEFPVNLPWDGRNSFGKAVASGVYLFIISNEQGEVGQGKFLVIRR